MPQFVCCGNSSFPAELGGNGAAASVRESARARETEAKEQGERESGGREREERGAWEEVRVEGYVG